MHRIQSIQSHLTSNQNVISQPNGKHADDVVICSAKRTCLSKAKRGPLKDTMPEVMLARCLEAVLKETKVDPKLVQDLAVGNCLQGGAGAVSTRAAQLISGIPHTSTAVAINRQCSSGIEACSMIASKIRSGVIDIGIGGGVESMTNFSMQDSVNPEMLSDDLFEHEVARNCLIPMGITADNIAEKYSQIRKDLDQFAVDSHKKAALAQKNGLFKEEIVPFMAKVKDANGKVTEVMADKDTGIRADASIEGFSKLKSAFKKNGWSTAGNSSQVTDGAAAVLMARRSVAMKLGLPILGKFVNYAVVGVPPEIMGVGPAYAIPQVLKQAGMVLNDVDIFEINEAFASQAKWSVDELKIPMEKVNPKGGAIALGHPLGCTGARQVATLMPELKRQGKTWGIISMCIGTGMGAAALIKRE